MPSNAEQGSGEQLSPKPTRDIKPKPSLPTPARQRGIVCAEPHFPEQIFLGLTSNNLHISIYLSFLELDPKTRRISDLIQSTTGLVEMFATA